MKNYFILLSALLMAACGNDNEYDAMGRFEATDVVVSAEMPGKILSLDVIEGCEVKADTQVGSIDTMQLFLQRKQMSAQLDAQLQSRPDIQREASSLRRQIEKQKKEKRRFARMLKEGAATQKQFDDIKAQLNVLEGSLDALLSRLGSSTASINSSAAALRAGIEQIDDQLYKCRVSSPISGVVLSKYAEGGEFVQPGRPLFKVADMNRMYLRSYFTSEQLADVKLGDKVRVVADFGGGARNEYEGTISNIASESEFTPKTIQTKDSRANLVYAVKIAVKNDGRLKIGFTGEVFL